MDIKYENGDLVITIPVNDEIIKKAPMSSSGKSKMVATTSGFIPVQEIPGVKLSLNLIAKP